MLNGFIEIVQTNLGVPKSGQWDATTAGALAPYQGGGRGPLAMYPTGQPDPATLINLGYYDPIELLSRGQRSYLEGTAEPTTFWRDLATASNQVPRWAWLVMGALFVGMGYYVYKQRTKAGR